MKRPFVAFLLTFLAGATFAETSIVVPVRPISLQAGTTGRLANGPILLKDYALPVDKTPLFVGGTGIIFEQAGGAVVARVYPIDPKARTEFWSSDGKTGSTVELRVQDWNRIKVTDTAAHLPVHSQMVRFAAQFTMVPGHSFLVE